MKQLNVPIQDEAMERAKIAALRSGLKLYEWVNDLIMRNTKPEPARAQR